MHMAEIGAWLQSQITAEKTSDWRKYMDKECLVEHSLLAVEVSVLARVELVLHRRLRWSLEVVCTTAQCAAH